MRKIFLAFLALFPWVLRKWIYQNVFGFKIGKNCYIGRSLVDVLHLDMAEGSRIGDFTIIRNLDELKIGKNASIGTFNWVSGYRTKSPIYFLEFSDRLSALEIGDESAITSRHILDCTDTISIGRMTTIAGHRSQFLTHSIDLKINRQSCAPIRIGDFCFLGTGIIVLRGHSVPDYSIVSAGSVVTRRLDSSGGVFAGNPAIKIRCRGTDYKYFERTKGSVS